MKYEKLKQINNNLYVSKEIFTYFYNIKLNLKSSHIIFLARIL